MGNNLFKLFNSNVYEAKLLIYLQITDKIALKIETAPDGTNQMFAQPIMSKYIF